MLGIFTKKILGSVESADKIKELSTKESDKIDSETIGKVIDEDINF